MLSDQIPEKLCQSPRFAGGRATGRACFRFRSDLVSVLGSLSALHDWRGRSKLTR